MRTSKTPIKIVTFRWKPQYIINKISQTRLLPQAYIVESIPRFQNYQSGVKLPQPGNVTAVKQY